MICVNKYIQFIIISLISILGIYFAFKGENISEVFFHLSQTNLNGVLIAVMLLMLSCIVRAYRWQLILKPFDFISLKSVFSATMIGYFGNSIMAFRLGELLKSYSVSKDTKINMMQAFGTVILERTLDVMAVLLIFFFLIPWFPFEDSYVTYATLGFSIGFLIVVFVIFLLIKYNFYQKLEHLKWFSYGLGLAFFKAFKKVFEGLTSLKKIESPWKIIISSLIIWSIYYIETIILTYACHIDLSMIEIGILLVLGSIAFGLPALPGSAGTYDAGIKYSLLFVFGISNYKAMNYTIVSHSVAFFPPMLIGLIYFIISSIKIRELQNLELNE